MDKEEMKRLKEFIQQTQKSEKASQEMHAEQIREPGPMQRATESPEALQHFQEQLEGWGRIPQSKLKEISAQMAVFQGDLLAKEYEFAWDPKQFKVKKISETEGVLVLESRGEN